jgi:DNA-binding transcriptional ArsR family regulator
MRPLFHPAPEDLTLAGILYALSDPVRGAIYAEIAGRQCTQNCSHFLNVSDRPIPKSTLSQHFRILRENGLIRAERHGVEMHFTPRCAEIESRFPGLMTAILKAHLAESREKALEKSAGRKTTKSATRR